MISKLYEKGKNYIKENWKMLLFFVAIFLLVSVPLPYYLYTGGGIIDISGRVQIEGGYESKGSFNFAYVSEVRATIPTYLLSYIIPSWEREKMESLQLSKNETEEDINYRNKLSLQSANQAAIEVAFQKAGKKFDLEAIHHYVNYISEESSTSLKIGDEILGMDGIKISSLSSLKEELNKREVGEQVTFQIKRHQKEEEATALIRSIDGQKMVGISFVDLYDYKTTPEVSLRFSESESGPSGGLMLALAIYNQLVEKDITHGKRIVGTGTIEPDGTVGPIGGVNYKLQGAVSAKADYFLVPEGENYDTCVKLKKEKKYEITLVKISTFDEAVTFLEHLK